MHMVIGFICLAKVYEDVVIKEGKTISEHDICRIQSYCSSLAQGTKCSFDTCKESPTQVYLH